MKLEEACQVMIGVLTKREHDELGENSYVLFSPNEEETNNSILKTDKDMNNKLAQKGDLLFRLLYPNRIIYVDEKIEGKLVPSQFCIIRPYEEKMDPIVLKWYLENNEEMLNMKVTGSIIKSMSLANLKNVSIPQISISKQKQMRELITLWEEEKETLNQILEEKEKLYNFYLQKMI